jgi:tetraacyldisaccharide 4'-kinase
VGNPDSFWRAAENTGVRAAGRLRYRDHHRYSEADVRNILDAARRANATALVTTEKDVINLPQGRGSWSLPFYWLKTRVTVDRADELLDLILSRCRLHARQRALG